MSPLQEQKEQINQKPKLDGGVRFCWGSKGNTHYESFVFHGVEYSLYDVVYMWNGVQAEPDVGKLVKIWETPTKEKKVEIVWFFRPSEIAAWLGDVQPLDNELLLACGQGQGLSNISPLESISGKCKVTCSSKDQRNCQPTEKELRNAHHIYFRTFDVGKCIISDQFPSTIDGIEVIHFFNRRKDQRSSILPEQRAKYVAKSKDVSSFVSGKRETSTRLMEDGPFGTTEKGAVFKAPGLVRDLTGPSSGDTVKISQQFRFSDPSVVGPLKKRRLIGSFGDAKTDPQASTFYGGVKVISAKDCFSDKDNLPSPMKKNEMVDKVSEKGADNPVSRIESYTLMEVSRRPESGASTWLKLQHWDESRLYEAHEKGTLLLLENLPLSLTSEEVEDIVWQALEQKVKAKMLPCTNFSSPHSGQALAICRSEEAADNCYSRLSNGCLVLDISGPIVCRKQFMKRPDPSSEFAGHLSIDRKKINWKRDDTETAVSTSHFSQANTVEYDLAMQWCVLQAKSEKWWEALHETHCTEVQAVKEQGNLVDKNEDMKE